jgi:hypothetical protein
MNGDPGSTQIRTWHYGARSQTVSQLMSPGTTLTSMSSMPSPSRLLQQPQTGSLRMLHHTLITQTKLRGFVKPSV